MGFSVKLILRLLIGTQLILMSIFRSSIVSVALLLSFLLQTCLRCNFLHVWTPSMFFNALPHPEQFRWPSNRFPLIHPLFSNAPAFIALPTHQIFNKSLTETYGNVVHHPSPSAINKSAAGENIHGIITNRPAAGKSPVPVSFQ